MSKKWWQFWKEQKNANTLGVLIRQSGNFTSYNFSAYIREAYQQNTTVYGDAIIPTRLPKELIILRPIS